MSQKRDVIRPGAMEIAKQAIDERYVGIQKERDALDEVIGQLETLRDDCEEALENLGSAREALSKYV